MNDENKKVNSKNINETAFKEQLSIILFSNLVFKHENIRLFIEINITIFRIMLLVSNQAIECRLFKC